MIPKRELIDGAWYVGSCRNASEAQWDEKQEKFVYRRYKFVDWFIEEINHPEDDDGCDCFIPYKIKVRNAGSS